MSLLTPSSYRLPWSRFVDKIPWYRAEVVATEFDENGDPVKWAIREAGSVLTKRGDWIYEPQPSSRTEKFLKRTRFNSPEEAAAIAAKYMANGL